MSTHLSVSEKISASPIFLLWLDVSEQGFVSQIPI